MTMQNPVPNDTTRTEPKVAAATAGASGGTVVALFILWFLDNVIITPNNEGDLPGPVVGIVTLLVAAAFTWAAGYVANHQYRDAEVTPPPVQTTRKRPTSR